MRFVAAPFMIVVLYLLVDFYLLRWVVRPLQRKRAVIAFVSIELVGLISILLLFVLGTGSSSDTTFYLQSVLLTISMAIFVPSLLLTLVDLISRTPMLFKRKKSNAVARAGQVVAVLALILIICGIFNRKRLAVNEETIGFSTLPVAFDGYRVVHISDLHLGSFGGDTVFVSAVVDKINSLEPDIVLFTGDVVTRRSSEMEKFVSTLSRLRGKDGVFAVLGNHDYSDYYNWPDTLARDSDRERLRHLIAEAGMTLLRDSSVVIRRGGDSIILIGTENIGRPPFAAYGSLHDAVEGSGDSAFRILMTHDPSLWTDSIARDSSRKLDLTLSGHTHAMQVRILGWSPSSLRDEAWGGLYSSTDGIRLLNVNIGIGTVGPLMRIGATPEISLLTLKVDE